MNELISFKLRKDGEKNEKLPPIKRKFLLLFIGNH